jgi:hypothetical protein
MIKIKLVPQLSSLTHPFISIITTLPSSFTLYTCWSIIKIKLALSSHLTHPPYLGNAGLALQLYTTKL